MNETNENEELKADVAPESEQNDQPEARIEAVSDGEVDATEEAEEDSYFKKMT